MATTCRRVRWRTLPHYARALVDHVGVPRPPGCSMIGGGPNAAANGSNSEAGGTLFDSSSSLPCGPPCNLYDEWGGAIMCGRRANDSRMSHTTWSALNEHRAAEYAR